MQTHEIKARITDMVPLTDTILQLTLMPETFIPYHAGQYLQILWADQVLSYSIANAPLGTHKYELHVRHSRENTITQALLTSLQEQGQVTIRLPLGQCSLHDLSADKPLIFIAGGTGFAPVKAIIEQLLFNGDKRPIALFWGARTLSDLYMDDKVKQWQAHVEHFRYYSLIASGRQPSLVDLFLRHVQQDLSTFEYVLSGPFDLVYDLRDRLVTTGVPRAQIFSDAFSFEQTQE